MPTEDSDIVSYVMPYAQIMGFKNGIRYLKEIASMFATKAEQMAMIFQESRDKELIRSLSYNEMSRFVVFLISRIHKDDMETKCYTQHIKHIKLFMQTHGVRSDSASANLKDYNTLLSKARWGILGLGSMAKIEHHNDINMIYKLFKSTVQKSTRRRKCRVSRSIST